MTISEERRAQILRFYFAEHWRVGTIARQLGLHHSTVERVLREAGVAREQQRVRRRSILDPFEPFIVETCSVPRWCTSRKHAVPHAPQHQSPDTRLAFRRSCGYSDTHRVRH